MDFVWFCLIGLCAGWLAGQFVKGGGQSLIVDLVIGVVGAILGGFIFGLLGIQAVGMLGALVCATVGAVVLLLIVRAVRKKV
jgi:uncharacterized membrane protein YeaQ/YmgE (transglycosylase-associated protein family)